MCKILVVEDDKLVRDNLNYLLSNEGYSVIQAEDGLKAFEYVSEAVPDLIISDIHMPKMSGFDLFKKLKNNTETESIPIIFLTADTRLQKMQEGISLGAADYLIKPYDLEELLDAVYTKLLGKKIY
jgi:DNA-binding response OmpR family regulator